MSLKSLLQTPTPNLEESKSFYRKLGFTDIKSGEKVLVTDGSAVIEINANRYARAGVKLYRPEWKSELSKIEKFSKPFAIENGYVVADPSGSWVYLMEEESGVDIPAGVPSSILGSYAGLSLEVVDLHHATNFWQTLGFKLTMGAADQGWLVLKNEDGLGVSVMKPMSCPHLFFNPSLTYFNGKNNPEIIANIRKAGILFAEEITQFNSEGIVDNVILRDPGGFGFFIFND